MEICYDLLGSEQITELGEADHVREQDHDALIATRDHRQGALEFSHRLGWKNDLQKLLGAAPLPVNLGDIALLLIVEPLLAKAGPDPGSQKHRIEGFGQVIIRTEFNTSDHALEL